MSKEVQLAKRLDMFVPLRIIIHTYIHLSLIVTKSLPACLLVIDPITVCSTSEKYTHDNLGWSAPRRAAPVARQHYSLQKGLMTERHHHHVKLIWLGCLTAHGWNNGPEFGYFSTWVALCWKPSNHLAATAEGRKKTIHFFGKHKAHKFWLVRPPTLSKVVEQGKTQITLYSTTSLIFQWLIIMVGNPERLLSVLPNHNSNPKIIPSPLFIHT